jgi:hypothetical protein
MLQRPIPLSASSIDDIVERLAARCAGQGVLDETAVF